MQVLETEWKGHNFRSRIEARWAVFFDALLIPYWYEPNGYQLVSGKYLPDFWLPQQQCHWEVKGQRPTMREMRLAGELAETTGATVYIAFGPPHVPKLGEIDESAFCFSARMPWAYDFCYCWCECPQCGQLGVQFSGWSNRINCPCLKNGRVGTATAPRLAAAYAAARAERFGT